MAAGDTFRCGRVALDGTAQTLKGRGITSGSEAYLANPGATNTIFVGFDNTVSATTGYPIAPGREIKIGVLNLSKLWVFGTLGDSLAWRTE